MALFGRKNEQDATLGKPPMGWGVPGVQKDESVDPEMEAMLLTAPAGLLLGSGAWVVRRSGRQSAS